LTRIKICGVTRPQDASAAAAAGADLIGIHLCPSRRQVGLEQALEIVAALDPGDRPELVGVFIDPSPREVEDACAALPLDWIQLHGNETAGQPYPRPVIKAIKVRDGVVGDERGWPDPLLLDAWTQDSRGGSGQTWDWDLARPLLGRRQVYLAGGLKPATVAALVTRLRPYGVDVSSGVERDPGRKDPDLIAAFVQAVRGVESDS